TVGRYVRGVLGTLPRRARLRPLGGDGARVVAMACTAVAVGNFLPGVGAVADCARCTCPTKMRMPRLPRPIRAALDLRLPRTHGARRRHRRAFFRRSFARPTCSESRDEIP